MFSIEQGLRMPAETEHALPRSANAYVLS